MEEKQIFIELKKGNKEAFKEFYRRYSLEMHEFAFSFLKNKKDTEDVVQDSFIAIYNKQKDWHLINDIHHYTFRIVQNQCLAKIRKNEAVAKKENEYNYYKISSSGHTATPDVIMAINNREIKRKIDRLFSFLSPQRKRAIELVYLEGKSYDEAADIMGIGTESIRTHLRLARNILKNNLSSLLYFITFLLMNK